MKTEEINKFVLALVMDKSNFVTNFSDLLVKLGVVTLHDTNADTFKHECSGGETFNVRTSFRAKIVRKELRMDKTKVRVYRMKKYVKQ